MRFRSTIVQAKRAPLRNLASLGGSTEGSCQPKGSTEAFFWPWRVPLTYSASSADSTEEAFYNAPSSFGSQWAPLRHFASSGVTPRCFTCPGTSAKTYRWVPLRYFARPSLAGSLSARSEGRSFRHLLCSGTGESGWRSRDQAVLAFDLGASDADSRPLPHNDSFANKYPYARQRTKTGKKLGMPAGLKFSFELHPNGAIDIA